MNYKPNHIDIITMGCSKNLIDSERLMRRLADRGYTMAHDPETPAGEYVMVNTCGFIGDAKEESINMLLELGRRREEGAIGKIAVMGCLSQRYMSELKEALPEVDFWFGKFDWTAFVESLPMLKDNRKTKDWERTLTTPPYSAYLKISEGCDRFCAFCAIPLITGRHTSRSIEEIMEEVRTLVSEGVKEFNIIAQDLSSYGLDLYGRHALPELIDRLAEIEGVKWLRLHYAYPSDFPWEITEVINRHENVAKYIDVALQHISDNMLSDMRRNITKQETLEFIARLRREVPDIKLRTTLMVGFPGETDKDFEELLDFVRTARFERMGAFAYSEEEDTYAARHLDDNVPPEVKQYRLDTLMRLQQEIALECQQEMIGRTVDVLIESIDEAGQGSGRTQWDSPEVDPEVIIRHCHASPGEYVKVKIEDASEFELYGTIVNHF